MGDIADDILDGFYCQTCGTVIGEYVGYPRNCDYCENAEKDEEAESKRKKKKARKNDQE